MKIETLRALAHFAPGQGEEELERPVDACAWEVPAQVELQGHRLVWRNFLPGGHPTRVYATPGLLEQFFKLADVPARQIRTFAARWGVLGLCQHGWPAWHGRVATLHGTVCYPSGELRGYESTFWEPIGAWRHYARQAAAIMRVACELEQDKPGADADWEILAEWYGSYRTGRTTASTWWNWPDGLDKVDSETGLLTRGSAMHLLRPAWSDTQRRLQVSHERGNLASVVDEWLQLGGARISFDWFSDRPRASIDVSGLLGGLGVQLMAAVGRVDAIACCTECRGFYAPGRRPAVGRANYCDAVNCQKAARRAASLKYSRKKRTGPSCVATPCSNGGDM